MPTPIKVHSTEEFVAVNVYPTLNGANMVCLHKNISTTIDVIGKETYTADEITFESGFNAEYISTHFDEIWERYSKDLTIEERIKLLEKRADINASTIGTQKISVYDACSDYNIIATSNIDTGSFPDEKNKGLTYFFEAKPNTTYIFSCKNPGDAYCVYEWDELYSAEFLNNRCLSNQIIPYNVIYTSNDTTPKSNTFITSENTKMVSIYLGKDVITTDIIIEEGPTICRDLQTQINEINTALDKKLDSFSDCNVITAPAGSDADASVTVKDGVATLNLTIPKGDPGVSISSVTQTTTSTEDSGENVITVRMSNGSSSTFKVNNGSKGSAGVRGSIWHSGINITGASTNGSVFTSSGISSANVNDYYLNTDTGYVYKCILGGNASTAKWAFVGTIEGPKGDKGDTPTIKAAAGENINTVGTPTVTASTSGTTTTFTFNNLKGAKGDKGDTGATGGAGVNGVTPTIKAAAGSNIGTVGTPSVTASTSGTTTTFTFDNLKGAKGDKGDPGTNGVTPTIKAAAGENINTVGTPSVTASTSGTTTTFTFNNLKGAKGDKGDKGDTGATGANGVTPTIKAAAGTNINTVGTPTVTASTSGTTTTFTFNNLKGAKGDTGAAGTTPTIKAAAGSNIGTVGTPSVTASTSGTTTTFTFNNLKGAKGDKGDKGDTGASGTNGVTPTIKAAAGSNIGTVGTPSVTATTSGTTTTFTFNNLKGAKGDKGDPGANATTTAVATSSANGLMSSTDKAKLDGIASGANKYSLPAATASALGGVKIGSNITNSSGLISISKTNVTTALGFTPATSDHTHTQYYSAEASRTANTVLAAPNGAAGQATFRKLVAADLPSHTHLYAKSETAGGPAYSVASVVAEDDANRHIWFSTASVETRRAYDDTFTYNPTYGQLKFKAWAQTDLTDQTVDLNNYNDGKGRCGYRRFVCKSTGGSSKISNRPSGVADGAFVLEVISMRFVTASTDYITKQVFHTIDGLMYQRFCTNGTWGSWHSPYYWSQSSRTANTVLAAPNGAAGKATFRKLVAADLPSHTHLYAKSETAGGPAYSVAGTLFDIENNTTDTYRHVWFSHEGDDTRKVTSDNFMFNPKYGQLKFTGWYPIILDGETISLDHYNDASGNYGYRRFICRTIAGSANISNKPVADNPFVLEVILIRYVSNTDYVTKQIFHSLDGKTYRRLCNGGTWGAWYDMTCYSSSISRTANTVLAAPNGSDGVATFRKLVAADLPSHTHSYLPLSGGTLTGNLAFKEVTSTTYPASSSYISFSGSTDYVRIGYQVTANDAGNLVFDMYDDDNVRVCFAYKGTIKSYINTSGNFSGNAGSASKLNNTAAIGSATQPVYFSASGVPVACTYTLGKSVPSNAVFTDTNTFVTQSKTTTENYRPLLAGSTNVAGIDADKSATVTAQAYVSSNIFVRPSTGSLFAGNLYAYGSGDTVAIYAYRQGKCSWRFINDKGHFTLAQNWDTETSAVGSWTNAVTFEYGTGYMLLHTRLRFNTSSDGIYYVGTSATDRMIRFLDGNSTSGNGMMISPKGLLMIGSGESTENLYTSLLDEGYLSGGAATEKVYISSDEDILFYSNCQTIANRVAMVFDTARNLRPGSDNAGSLGTSTYRWATAYITTINGTVTNVAGTASTTDQYRHVWFSTTTETKRAYNDNFTYNPSKAYLKITKGAGTTTNTDRYTAYTYGGPRMYICSTGGYAMGLSYFKQDDTCIGGIGLYGSGANDNPIKYYYIGPGYDSKFIRIYETSGIVSYCANSYRMCAGGYGAFLRNDGDSTYILLTNKMTDGSEDTASYNSFRPLSIKNSTGICNINGNSATATKLQTARTINRVSFNGTANIKVPVYYGYTIYEGSDASTYCWYKLVSANLPTNTTHCDLRCVLLVSLPYGGAHQSAIISIRARSEDTVGVFGSTIQCYTVGPVALDFPLSSFVLVADNKTDTAPGKVTLWAKLPGRYHSIFYSILQEGYRTTSNVGLFTIYDNNGVKGETAVPTGTAKNVTLGIPRQRITYIRNNSNTDIAIKVGYDSTSVAAASLNAMAGFTSSGELIKNVSKSVLNEWLGLTTASASTWTTVTIDTVANNDASITLTGTLAYRKTFGFVELYIKLSIPSNASNLVYNFDLAILPTDYRPTSYTRYNNISSNTNITEGSPYITVATSGYVKANGFHPSTPTRTGYCSIMYRI
jgi:hypothetical protein